MGGCAITRTMPPTARWSSSEELFDIEIVPWQTHEAPGTNLDGDVDGLASLARHSGIRARATARQFRKSIR